MESAAKTLQAVILAGGTGSRLGALTQSTPKPLLTVAGRPFLDYLLWNLWRHGFGDVVLLAGYQANQIEDFAARCDYPGTEITCVTEPAPAGTGGALRQAVPILHDNFLLLNGDSLFDINLLDLIDADKGLGARLGRLALRHLADVSRSGTVSLSGDRITRFAARPEQGGPGLINGGVYWLSRDILDFVPAPPCSLEQDVFPRLAESRRLDGRVYDNFFIDIGITDDLARSEELIPACFHRPAAFLRQSTVVESDTGDGPVWRPGAVRAIRMFNDCNYYVFVLSAGGQSGRAAWLNDRLRGIGAHVDGLLPDDGPGSAETTLRDAMRRWNVRGQGSVLVGDGAADLALADSLGIAGRSRGGDDLWLHLKDFMSQWGVVKQT